SPPRASRRVRSRLSPLPRGKMRECRAERARRIRAKPTCLGIRGYSCGTPLALPFGRANYTLLHAYTLRARFRNLAVQVSARVEIPIAALHNAAKFARDFSRSPGFYRRGLFSEVGRDLDAGIHKP